PRPGRVRSGEAHRSAPVAGRACPAGRARRPARPSHRPTDRRVQTAAAPDRVPDAHRPRPPRLDAVASRWGGDGVTRQDRARRFRVGSLFSGYGGLDMAVCKVFGAEVVWHCEIDEAASRILAHHWPDVPNLGDITAVDWHQVEPVDILVGGFPCQDLSSAGRRAGLRPGTRSGLWQHMAYAIAELRPQLVVIENV